MATLDSIFKKEFREVSSALRSVHSIYDIHNPLEGKLPIIKDRVYRIKGIEDPVFSVLNDTVVFALTGVKPERRVIDVRTGKVKKDVADNEVKETPTTPKGSVWVRTTQKVNIPRKGIADEFNFADMWLGAPNGGKYIYAIPKKYLYEIQLCALAASSRKLKAFSGYQFNTWTFGKLNVAVIPYNPNSQYQNTIILGTKPQLDFSVEMRVYVEGLIREGVIPDIPFFTIDNGYVNLVETPIEAAFNDFEGESEISLEERGALTYAQAEMQDMQDNPTVEWNE